MAKKVYKVEAFETDTVLSEVSLDKDIFAVVVAIFFNF